MGGYIKWCPGDQECPNLTVHQIYKGYQRGYGGGVGRAQKRALLFGPLFRGARGSPTFFELVSMKNSLFRLFPYGSEGEGPPPPLSRNPGSAPGYLVIY